MLRLKAEARANPALAAALPQITTGSEGMPGTLGILRVVQGGADQLHVLASYPAGEFESGVTAAVASRVEGRDPDFALFAPPTSAATPWDRSPPARRCGSAPHAECERHDDRQ